MHMCGCMYSALADVSRPTDYAHAPYCPFLVPKSYVPSQHSMSGRQLHKSFRPKVCQKRAKLNG